MTEALRRQPEDGHPMLQKFAPAIRGLILDMDGVLWKDANPIGHLPAIFDAISSMGLGVMAVTNNATKTPAQYVRRLGELGVSVEPWQILTSAEATAKIVAEQFPNRGSVFVVGEHGIIVALQEQGFDILTHPGKERNVIAVVAGIDRTFSYEKLRRAAAHVRQGASYYGTNPDATFPTPDGLLPGAGSVLAAISVASGVTPKVIGKPSPAMFEVAALRMQLSPGEILVVGDRLETDIAGGQAFGARTALVLSGVSTRQDAASWNPAPDLIAEDLSQLVGVVEVRKA